METLLGVAKGRWVSQFLIFFWGVSSFLIFSDKGGAGRDDFGVATQIRFLHRFYEIRNRTEALELCGKPQGWLLYPPRKVHL